MREELEKIHKLFDFSVLHAAVMCKKRVCVG